MKRFTTGDGGIEDTKDHHPRYDHDCELRNKCGCLFLGHSEQYDLWACLRGKQIDTVIARRSSEGSDYKSGLSFACYDKHMYAALARAEHLGYRSRFDLTQYVEDAKRQERFPQ